MKEVPNILAFARTLVVHFGSDAVGIAEGHVEMHRRAKESNEGRARELTRKVKLTGLAIPVAAVAMVIGLGFPAP